MWGSCAFEKQTRVRFQYVSTDQSKILLECVHSDACELAMTSTFGGMKYFVTLIDDKSRHCAVYLMQNKSKVLDKFVHFIKLAKNKTYSRLKFPWRNNSGEYCCSSNALAKR